MEEEQPGLGERVVQNTIGITDDSSAHALAEYMRTAFYAGRASSAERKREFCGREINSLDELLQASEDRESMHNAELKRVVDGAVYVVSADDYSKLVSYAKSRRSNETVSSFDLQAAYIEASGSIDVSQELARRCGD